MSFVKYQNTNNASSLLIADITASQTTILITDWDQSLFPSSFPFLLTLEHLDANENVILREIVKAVSWNQNSFTVERSAWICVQDDTAHAFYSWDRISLYWTAEQVADIQNNLEAKWNQDAIANVYDNTATYAVWDIVVYKGDRYVCQTAVATAEEFDSSKWTKVNIQYELDEQDARITELENKWWDMKIDVLIVWWWGWGWNAWCNVWNWWWGWGWWVKILYWININSVEYNVVVWAWGAKNNNWWTSCFWQICALWWWWGWQGRWAWTNFWYWKTGANWWWAWSHCNQTTYEWWWAIEWWNIWWPTFGCFCNIKSWWGWGGAWWIWWLLIWLLGNRCFNFVWWIWIKTCFDWTVKFLWWWGWGWGASIASVTDVNYTYDGKHFWWGAWWQSSAWCNWTANTWWGWGWWYASTWTQPTRYDWWTWGSWLVIVRYPKDCSYWIACATWWTITTPTINGIQYVVHTFTSSWTFCITETA